VDASVVPLVGLAVGSSVLTVGVDVGRAVGPDVGFLVAAAVGEVVGTDVTGDSVGADVTGVLLGTFDTVGLIVG